MVNASCVNSENTVTPFVPSNSDSTGIPLALELDSLRSIIDQHTLLTVTDRHGRIIHANSGFCRISGYTAEELIGQDHRILSSGVHTASFWEKMWEKISAGETWRSEVSNRQKDGSCYWVDTTIVPQLGPDGVVEQYVAIRFDISNSKARQASMSRAQAMIEQTGQLAKIGGWEIDLESKQLDWSDEVFHIHDLPIGDSPTLEKSIEYVARDFQGKIREAINDAILFGGFWDLEMPITTAKGKKRWVRSIGLPQMEAGECKKLWGALQDITEQHQSKEQLVELSNRLKAATEGANVGIWEYRCDTFEYVWDRMTFELHDINPGHSIDIAAQLNSRIFSQDRYKVQQEFMHSAVAGKGLEIEYRIRDQQEQLRFIQAIGTFESNQFGLRRLVGVCRDMTVQRLAEQRLTQAMRISRIGLWDWNIHSNLIDASDTYYTMLGYEASVKPIDHGDRTRLIHPDDSHRALALLDEHLAGRTPIYKSEHRLRCKDGSWRWIQDVGEVIERDSALRPQRMIGVHVDIQEPKEMATRLELTISSAKAGLWDWNISNKTISTNELWHKMLGKTNCASSILEEEFYGLLHPSDIRSTVAALERAFVQGEEDFDVEFRFRCVDGSYKWIHSTGQVIERDENGKALRMIGQNSDVDAHRTALGNVETLNLELADQIKYTKELATQAEAACLAKSEFLANMSHEIRTPMTAILGFSENLSESIVQPENKAAVETIRRNGEHLLGVINDILDLSKIEAGQFEVEKIHCPVPEILKEIKDLMAIRAEAKGLKWDVHLDSSVPSSIKTDPARLRQILINLISNGIKFTEVGVVMLKCRAEKTADEKGMLYFDVIDSGIGMNQTQLRLLFQPFVQADNSMSRRFGGTGLGLTISKRFAGLMGGDIEVQSEKGKGSIFTLRIPFEPQDVTESNQSTVGQPTFQEKEKAVQPPAQNPLQGLRLLLVEDGPDNQRLISFLLKRVGAEVEIADNGQTGRDCALKALANGRPFDVIITDMQMPVMDGYTATSQLRAMNYTGPIIALTAHAMKGDREKCIDAGCDDFATKPVDRTQLIEIILKYAKIGAHSKLGTGEPQ